MISAEELAKHASNACGLLKKLSNEKRLTICCCLGDSEMNVRQIAAHVDLSQSALSQHPAHLRETGIVSTRKQSQAVYYRLCCGNTQRVISALIDIFCPDKVKTK